MVITQRDKKAPGADPEAAGCGRSFQADFYDDCSHGPARYIKQHRFEGYLQRGIARLEGSTSDLCTASYHYEDGLRSGLIAPLEKARQLWATAESGNVELSSAVFSTEINASSLERVWLMFGGETVYVFSSLPFFAAATARKNALLDGAVERGEDPLLPKQILAQAQQDWFGEPLSAGFQDANCAAADSIREWEDLPALRTALELVLIDESCNNGNSGFSPLMCDSFCDVAQRLGAIRRALEERIFTLSEVEDLSIY